MHIPVAREEISRFLEMSEQSVSVAWETGELQRTISCPNRTSPLLNYTSQYDVLEFALSSGSLPACLTKEQAALWISALAEADECDCFQVAQFEDQVCHFVRMAVEDNLGSLNDLTEKIARTILLARSVLSQLCDETDRSTIQWEADGIG